MAQTDNKIIIMKQKEIVIFQALFTFLLALCSADAHPDYEPPYGEKLNPKPFQYEYGLESASSGAVFSKKEAQVW